MTELLKETGKSLSEYTNSVRHFAQIYRSFEPGFIKIADEGSRLAIGIMTQRNDYEIYELDINAGFCTIQHRHRKAYEIHIVISGEVIVQQHGIEHKLVAGQSITTDKDLAHVFMAVKDSKVITIAVPTLHE